MKLSVLKRINKEELKRAGGDIPKWIDALLNPLNTFIENVGSALQGRLTFEENFLCKVTVQTFIHGVPKEINPYPDTQRNFKIVGVIPLFCEADTISLFNWSQKSNGNISVAVSFQSAPTNERKVKLLILLG